MKFVDRQEALREWEELRPGRLCVSLFNLDRLSNPVVPGLTTQFAADVKEPLFRVLKESYQAARYKGIDLCLYTRGGETNAVWPIVNLLREFDKEFHVLVPFRCHSSGTLVALGAKSILMGPLSELSPIDPTCGNQFNPTDPNNANAKIGISVEDVQSYRNFIFDTLQLGSTEDQSGGKRPANWRAIASPYMERLATQVHPLALGNVYRVTRQIEKLATCLLRFHPTKGEKVDTIVGDLTSRFFSHIHMLDRNEARSILGDRVVFANEKISAALDKILSTYKQSFRTWAPFFWTDRLGDKPVTGFKLVGGVVESRHWSYLYRTEVRVTQNSIIPPGLNVQMPANQPMPLIQGLPRQRVADVVSQGWVRNSDPTGVTI